MTLWRRVQNKIIFKTQRRISIFENVIFTGNNETDVGHLHSLFFIFATVEALFYKFCDCAIKPETWFFLLGG